MKDSLKLQRKLSLLLPKYPGLRLKPGNPPWTPSEFRRISSEVNLYATQSGEVVNDDPLYDWLEEYQFFLSQGG